ncbi:MAG: hypothetical protein HOL29_09460 [Euryarchaeota archaeon]|jgi:hypothetical protein|nr:hypothetical protein [Euryarchaeota archaeon]
MANNFKNAFATSVSTNSSSPTAVYTANNGSAVNSILIELDVANTGSSAVQVTVQLYDSSGTASYHIVKNAPIPSGGALKVVSGQKVVLNGDDQVRVYASASTVDVVCSILEDVA